MDVKLILIASVALQLIAAALTLRILPRSTARVGWLAIVVAIGLMVTRGTITLFRTFNGSVTPDVTAETFALLISVFVLVGVATLGRKLRTVAKSERTLRESGERYKLALVGTKDGVWDWDLHTDDVYYNPGFKKLLGYEESEFDHKLASWTNRLHPDDHDRIYKAVEVHHANRSTYDVEYRLKTKSGEYRWFRTRGNSVWDADGRAIRMAGAIQDITEQKQAELVLQESEERFRQVTENISEVFWLTDWITKELLYVSPNYEAVFGRSVESLRMDRRSWLAAVCAEDRDRISSSFASAAEAGVFVEEEYRIVSPDGSERWIRDRAFPLRDQAGEVYRIVGVAEDVTDRKNALRELDAASARMNAVFANIADSIILIDDKGTVEGFNRSAEKLFGYAADEVVGKNVKCLMPDPFRSEHDGYIATFLRTGIKNVIGARREVMGRRNDESIFPLELHVSEVDLGDRRIYCGVVTDLTFRKEAAELTAKHSAELAHVARLNTMGEMAAGLAHEISQPLTAIVNYTAGSCRQLRDGAPVTPELIDALDRASSQARRAGEIIHRLYDFAQKREPRKDRVNVSELIGDVLGLLAAELRSAEVKTDCELGEDLPAALGDNVQLQQVVINLIMNGIEAMALTPVEGRHIQVSAQEGHDNEIQVSISDKGHGLRPDTRQNIFDQFHTTKEGGLGMGLSISRSIIESHGGRLTASNNRSGGATFSFTLPCPDGKENA